MAISLLLPAPLSAYVAVTEIMYDLAEGSDSGREWIEVYATGPTDLTELKFVENGSNHAIRATRGAFIPSGAYAVIADNPAKFAADYPGYAGFLFDSAFSLSNDGESIAISDAAGNTIDIVVYTSVSANGTGDSLQRHPGGNQFDAGVPTPGVGIPQSGLARSAPPKKTSKRSVTAAVAVAQKIEIVGKADFPAASSANIAAAAAPPIPLSLWVLATSLLAFGCAVGLAYSRHLKKNEWDIIEEIEETS